MVFEWDEKKNQINKIRIISARLANKKEKEIYYGNN